MRELLFIFAILVDLTFSHPAQNGILYKRQIIPSSGLPTDLAAVSCSESMSTSTLSGSSASDAFMSSCMFESSETAFSNQATPTAIGNSTIVSSALGSSSSAFNSSTSSLVISSRASSSIKAVPTPDTASTKPSDTVASTPSTTIASSSPAANTLPPLSSINGTQLTASSVTAFPNPSPSSSALSLFTSASSADSSITSASSLSNGISASLNYTSSTFLSASFPSAPSATSTGIGEGDTSIFTSSPSDTVPTSVPPTITDGPVLSTIKVSSVSTQTANIQSIKTNTQIETTDNTGHHTIVPFLVGCWFCPPSGGGGLLLWGIGPGPGIYPPPVPPPVPSFPTITIGNDKIPTPAPRNPNEDPTQSQDPSTKSNTEDSGSQTASTSPISSASSSGDCSATIVTDYWVSCASSQSASCSTYSSSIVTGCTASAVTSTTVALCSFQPTPIDENTLFPEETTGPEYDFVDPRKFFADIYDPENYESLGSFTSNSVSPPGSASSSASGSSSAPSSGSATHSASLSASASPGASASSSFASITGTSKGAGSSGTASATSATSTASEGPPLCVPFQDPDQGIRGYCQCESSGYVTTTPYLTSTDNMCGYTSLNPPPISTTTIQEPTRDPNNPFPWTTTNDAGTVIACESSALSEMNVAASVHLTFTTCAGESTTISTPTPTADCRFWDEGWGWSFQVYNIKNWDTGDKDVNDRLRDEEGGCGALTGWEFGEHPEGAEAWFNLPFFIKEGCVERAIKSAGGPKLACDPSGLGKRAFDDGSTSQPKQRRAGTNPAPNLDDPEIAEAYNPTGIDLAKIEHSYQAPNWKRSRRDLKARGIIVSSDVRKRGAKPNSPPNLDDPDVAAAYQPSGIDLDGIDHSYTPAQWDNKYKRGRIVKRGCFPSKIRPVSPAPGSPVTTPLPPALCDPILPGVDECNEQIQVRGHVGPKISLFYTGWGTGGGATGGTMTRKWAAKNLCGQETVSWTNLVDGDWKVGVQEGVLAAYDTTGMTPDQIFLLNDKFDPFLKHLSQGFAELSRGDVYVFIPTDQLPNDQWRMDSAWGGWEYPALTRNPAITRILRVDLDVSDYNDPKGTPREIWKQGDPPASWEPKGLRGPSLPEGLPADKIPVGWQGP